MGERESRAVDDLWRFVISGRFIVQLAIAVVVSIVLVLLVLKFLDIYTRHGDEIDLPDFRNMTIAQIDSAGLTRTFDLSVIDSVYSDELEGGTVVLQEPPPGTDVKKGRNVYLTTVAYIPEKVPVPDLKYLTLRQALHVLEASKLKPGKLIYKPSFDRNAVLQQIHLGDSIPADTIIFTGSVIDLVLGSGIAPGKIYVPFLLGKKPEEARRVAYNASMNIGKEVFMNEDEGEGTMRVYRQDPLWDTETDYYPGDSVFLWYRSEKYFNFGDYLKQFDPDTVNRQTESDKEEFE